MKNLKYTILLLAVLFGLHLTVAAQDSRNRVASTIIADGLAQLPAQNLEALEQVMGEIAGTGAEGVQQLAAMLGPSAEGKNAPFQYAIDGLTSYVTQKGRETACAAVKKGLEAALAKCTDEGNKTFLQDQLNKLTPGSVEVKHAVEDLSAVDPASRVIAEFRDKVAATPANKVGKLLLNTVKKSDNRQLRNTALELGGAALAPLAVKALPKLKTDAQTDVIRWLGNRHDTENIEAVFRALGSSNDQLANAAIEAAGKIGGLNALSSLIVALNGDHAAAASAALSTFNGNIADGVLYALKSQGSNATPALVALAGERHITAAYEPLTALLSNNNLRDVAAKSLAAIVTEDKFSDLLSRFQPYPDHYFGLMAQRANKEDIQALTTAAASSTAARSALLQVASADVVEPLMQLAKGDSQNRDAMLSRALTLTKGTNWASLTRYQLYKQALERVQPTTTWPHSAHSATNPH